MGRYGLEVEGISDLPESEPRWLDGFVHGGLMGLWCQQESRVPSIEEDTTREAMKEEL